MYVRIIKYRPLLLLQGLARTRRLAVRRSRDIPLEWYTGGRMLSQGAVKLIGPGRLAPRSRRSVKVAQTLREMNVSATQMLF